MSTQQALGIPAPDWQGRIKNAVYKDPSGRVHAFEYGPLSRDTPLRAAKFSFNGINGHYVQQNGHDGRDYPMRCIFWGPDHDLAANNFEAALVLPGIGRLTHPLYGSELQVVPYGTIGRRNDLVEGANQSIVEITFSTQLPSIYPMAEGVPPSEIETGVSNAPLRIGAQYEASLQITSVIDEAGVKAAVRNGLGAVKATLQPIADATAATKRQFDERYRLINEGLDTLVGAPATLAQQIYGLVLSPARAASGLASRVDGYALLLERLFGFSLPKPGASLASALRANANDFLTLDVFGAAAMAARVLAIVDEAKKPAGTGAIASKPSAQTAAVTVLDDLEAWTAWRESRFESLDAIDTGETFESIQAISAKSAGYLVGLSFGLLPERSIVTDRARTIIDLCAQLYGVLDDAKLQFLIDTNRLTGSDILEVPKGRTIVYYA